MMMSKWNCRELWWILYSLGGILTSIFWTNSMTRSKNGFMKSILSHESWPISSTVDSQNSETIYLLTWWKKRKKTYTSVPCPSWVWVLPLPRKVQRFMSFQWFSWQVCSPKFEIHSCFLQILNHHFVKHQMADVQSLIWNDEPGQLNIPHIRLCAPWKNKHLQPNAHLHPTTHRSESETSCSALWTAGARRNVMEWRTTMAWGGGSLTEMDKNPSHWIPLVSLVRFT